MFLDVPKAVDELAYGLPEGLVGIHAEEAGDVHQREEYVAQLLLYPPNDATTLVSTITFTPTQTGAYYVEVKISPNKPFSAGRYGTYPVAVTSP